jgi:hypothetical protein
MDLEQHDPYRGFRFKQRLLQLCAYAHTNIAFIGFCHNGSHH